MSPAESIGMRSRVTWSSSALISRPRYSAIRSSISRTRRMCCECGFCGARRHLSRSRHDLPTPVRASARWPGRHGAGGENAGRWLSQDRRLMQRHHHCAAKCRVSSPVVRNLSSVHRRDSPVKDGTSSRCRSLWRWHENIRSCSASSLRRHSSGQLGSGGHCLHVLNELRVSGCVFVPSLGSRNRGTLQRILMPTP